MAVRVTEAEVKSIMDEVTVTDLDIATYIIGANALVNSVLGTGTTDILKEIERWLTAHLMACTRERMAKKEGAGGAVIEYTGEGGQGLSSTSYGQVVKMLDTTGAMAALDKKKVSIYAIKSFD